MEADEEADEELEEEEEYPEEEAEAHVAQVLRDDHELLRELEEREARRRSYETAKKAQRRRYKRLSRMSTESVTSSVEYDAPATFVRPERPTYDEELRMEEEDELANLREMLARPEGSIGRGRGQSRVSGLADGDATDRGALGGGGSTTSAFGGGGSVTNRSTTMLSSSARDGNVTDRTTTHNHEDLPGRWAHRSGRSVPGRWNKAQFKPVPHALRGITPMVGVSQNEPWSTDVMDTCARLGASPSEALYATTGLKRLDDGQYDNFAMLHRRRAAEDRAAAALSTTSRPAWDPRPWTPTPAALRGVKPVTREPWEQDSEAFNERRAAPDGAPGAKVKQISLRRDVETNGLVDVSAPSSWNSWRHPLGSTDGEKPPWRYR